ncbi:MAG: c-type cytochrome [Gammaproteobacteria bacterium]
MSEQQDPFVKTFSMLIFLMGLMTVGLIILGVVISAVTDPGPDPMELEAAAARIQPVGKVALSDGTLFVSSSLVPQVAVVETEPAEEATPTAAPVEVAVSGESVYNTACVTCHGTGLAGAPRHGEPADWQARLSQGIDVLYDHSLNGFQAMPAKGGFMHLPDDQIKMAVDYMVAAVE